MPLRENLIPTPVSPPPPDFADLKDHSALRSASGMR